MPIVDHPCFSQPSDDDGDLWRYTDLLKTVSLLNHSAAYLTNLVRMASLDPYEGILPAKYYEHRNWRLPSDLPGEVLKEIESCNPEDLHKTIANRFLQDKSNREKYAKIAGWVRRACYLNCWHHNKIESAAMWQVYAQRGFGIAIRTNVARIKKAFENEDRELYIGVVQYRDYDTHFSGFTHFFSHVLTKRVFFQHENEVRLVHFARDSMYPDADMPPPCSGIYANCALGDLIDEIVVSPYEPEWVFEELKRLISQYQIDVPVRHSQLMKPPLV